MVNIPKNQNVKKRGDVQNVITSVILRQHDMFSKEDIYEGVEANIKFSCFGKYGKKRKEINVKEMVDDTLNILLCNRYIKYFSEEKKYKLTMSFPAVSKIWNQSYQNKCFEFTTNLHVTDVYA